MQGKAIQELSRQEYRKFGLTFAVIIALLFGAFFPWLLEARTPIWPFVLSAIFLLWALALPSTLRAVYKPWMRFAAVLGFINTRLILSLIYLLIFTPVALALSLFRVDLLDRRVARGEPGSYWKTCSQTESKRMEDSY